MNQPSTTDSKPWRERLQKFGVRFRGIMPFASGVLAALFALILYNLIFPGPHQLTEREINDRVAQAIASATPLPPFSERVYQVIQPSLVLIETTIPSENDEDNGSLGSGVVIDDRGDILTSLHVVVNASDIKVTFADGFQSSAQIIARQPENDIAVLSVDQQPTLLVPAVLGNPNAMQVGDEAYAVGNPFGLYSSMSSGIISGFNRSFEPQNSSLKLHGLIQIDAAVNPGNSGGPLLNRNGQVIGIVTGIVNPTEENFFVGIGFAVPINVAAGAAGSPPY
jgi:S1-C subfamily serine protease